MDSVKNLSSAVNLSELDFKNLIPIDHPENFKLAKIIIDSISSNRRVEEKCEVRIMIQKYLCIKEDNNLKIYNKDYKNISCRQIEKMNLEEGIIRKCLLTMYDGEKVWFVVHKDYDNHQYQIAIRDLKVQDSNIYSDFLYYLIRIDSIIYPQPAEPKSIHTYDKFIKKYQEEIRYLISKDLYATAISWSNAISNKFFKMGNELKKQMTDQIKKKLLSEMKSILLNKTLALIKKPGKENKKDYEEVIKLITKEYYVYFPSDRDDKYIKITARLAKCYLELKDFDLCQTTLNELLKFSNDETLLQIQKSLDVSRRQLNVKSKKTLIDFFYANISQDDKHTWDTADEIADIQANLDQSVINLLNIKI